VLLKTPTYTITQKLQLCAFLKENFHIETDAGIARTIKTQDLAFMYIIILKRHFGRNIYYYFFFYVTLHNIKQTRCLHFVIHLQNKQELKCKGIQNTKTHND